MCTCSDEQDQSRQSIINLSETMKSNPTILLVEDELQQREVLTMLLESQGYSVISVMDAEDGLRRINQTPPDMIVTDVKLPGMDGFTFFEQLRFNLQYQNIPFIFITGYNDLKAIEQARALGAVAYVTKPYNLEDLLLMVRSHLPSVS